MQLRLNKIVSKPGCICIAHVCLWNLPKWSILDLSTVSVIRKMWTIFIRISFCGGKSWHTLDRQYNHPYPYIALYLMLYGFWGHSSCTSWQKTSLPFSNGYKTTRSHTPFEQRKWYFKCSVVLYFKSASRNHRVLYTPVHNKGRIPIGGVTPKCNYHNVKVNINAFGELWMSEIYTRLWICKILDTSCFVLSGSGCITVSRIIDRELIMHVQHFRSATRSPSCFHSK